MSATEKSDFTFLSSGHGHYRVIYKSPVTFKKWYCITSNMQLIDETHHSEEPKIKDLEYLKKLCKQGKQVTNH